MIETCNLDLSKNKKKLKEVNKLIKNDEEYIFRNKFLFNITK